MKSLKVNLVIAWQWLEKELEERDLTSTQQLTLFHLFIKINRNFWKPARVSINKLAVAMGKDKRTVKKALEELIELGLVSEVEGGYWIGICEYQGLARTGKASSSENRRGVGTVDGAGNGYDGLEKGGEIDGELSKRFG